MGKAKCKKCLSIIESLHTQDYVTCKCGAIAVDGGKDYFRAIFDQRENFICIDKDGNEIVPTLTSEPTMDEITHQKAQELWQNEHLNVPAMPMIDLALANASCECIEEMIAQIERLPPHALYAPVSHADYLSLLRLFQVIMKGFGLK